MTLKKLPFVTLCLALAVLTSILFFTTGCNQLTPQEAESTTPVATSLSREQVENLVRRSYQYVAMFNVIQKFALDPATGGMFMDGFNRPVALNVLTDHTMKSTARPNNDTLIRNTSPVLENICSIENPLYSYTDNSPATKPQGRA